MSVFSFTVGSFGDFLSIGGIAKEALASFSEKSTLSRDFQLLLDQLDLSRQVLHYTRIYLSRNSNPLVLHAVDSAEVFLATIYASINPYLEARRYRASRKTRRLHRQVTVGATEEEGGRGVSERVSPLCESLLNDLILRPLLRDLLPSNSDDVITTLTRHGLQPFSTVSSRELDVTTA